MKIKEFVIETKKSEATVYGLIQLKKYISSSEKVRIAKEVIDLSAEYDRGFVKFDTYKRHLVFLFCVIEAHTDLRFADSWAEKMQEYDELCENRLLDMVVDMFREDYEASMEVLDMMCDDLLADNSVEASVAKLAQSVSENLDVFVGALSDKLEDIDVEKIIPKDLDLNKLQRLLNKIK